MKSPYTIIVVIPVGPATNLSFLADTIESVKCYCSSTYKIILVDDSQQSLGTQLQRVYQSIDVLIVQKNLGVMAGLYINLSLAYEYALSRYDFEMVLKLDTDALIIGHAPEKIALEMFRKHPLIGIAGQYPNDFDGKGWDVEWPRARILNGTKTWKYIRHPVANLLLRKLFMRAQKNGYRPGESVFGGAYFMSVKMLEVLRDLKLLPNMTLQTLRLGEDHLFSLLAMSVGFTLGDLASGSLPFACAWKGLPASPKSLIEHGKKIVHSTRGWNNMTESEIRNYFYKQRQPYHQDSIQGNERNN